MSRKRGNGHQARIGRENSYTAQFSRLNGLATLGGLITLAAVPAGALGAPIGPFVFLGLFLFTVAALAYGAKSRQQLKGTFNNENRRRKTKKRK